MSVQDLAAVGEQLEHFELAAVGGHHDVAVVFAQELDVQHLVAVAHKLVEVGGEEGGGRRVNTERVESKVIVSL